MGFIRDARGRYHAFCLSWCCICTPFSP